MWVWLVGYEPYDNPEWWEVVGIFTTREAAVAACSDGSHFVVAIPTNTNWCFHPNRDYTKCAWPKARTLRSLNEAKGFIK